MATVGNDVAIGGDWLAFTYATTQPHFLFNTSGTYTTVGSENITEVGFYGDDTDPGTFEIGVYRNNSGTWALVVSGQVSTSGTGRVVTAVSASVGSGVELAIGVRCVTEGYAHINTTFSGSGTRNTGLTGADALAATFTDTGPGVDSRFSFFATTASASSQAPRSSAFLRMLMNN